MDTEKNKRTNKKKQKNKKNKKTKQYIFFFGLKNESLNGSLNVILLS